MRSLPSSFLLLSLSAAVLLADCVVTSNADSGNGTLRECVNQVNNGEKITFANDMDITLESQIVISKAITIDGENHNINIKGINSREFLLQDGSVTFQNLTFSDCDDGSHLYILMTSAMSEAMQVVLRNVIVKNNTFLGAAVRARTQNDNFPLKISIQNSKFLHNQGGGSDVSVLNLYSSGHIECDITDTLFQYNDDGVMRAYTSSSGDTIRVNISNSAIVNNSGAINEVNSIIYNYVSEGSSTFSITNTTIAKNSLSKRDNQSYLIFNHYHENSKIFLNNVTIANNDLLAPSDTDPDPLIYQEKSGTRAGEINIKNTIIENNTFTKQYTGYSTTTTANCNEVHSYGYNLIAETAGCNIIEEANSGTDIKDVDAGLQPLADNGGPTPTMALGPVSPAIDAADGTDIDGNPVTVDQRGVSRPQGMANDIGAYEREASSVAVPLSPLAKGLMIGGFLMAALVMMRRKNSLI